MQKIIKEELLDSLQEAYTDDTASGHNWASAIVREMSAFLQAGHQLVLGNIIFSDTSQLQQWLLGNGYTRIILNQSDYDTEYYIKKLNINIQKTQVKTMRFEISKYSNNLFEYSDASLHLGDFGASFNNVVFHDFEDNPLTISDLFCSAINPSDIYHSKADFDVVGISFKFQNILTQKQERRVVICREFNN